MDKNIYEVSDIMSMLNISRASAYKFIQKVHKENGPFPVLKIGKNYRIPKKPFDEWIGMC